MAPGSSPVRVSVIVVNWNRCALLKACLESLARQEGVVFEVIVVDNGSHDGSVEMVRAAYESHSRFTLRMIVNPDNRGFCAANNQGIAAARGEFIALLNNDAEAEPLWLASLLELFARGPQVGMAASKIVVWEDPGRIDKVGHLIYADGQNRGRGSGQRDRGQFDREEEVAWPDGCAAMYRRSMLDQIGGFDEDFFAYADDAELGLRARIAGWSCLYSPRAVVRHHRGSTLGQLSFRRLELIERNRVLLAVKHFPWSLLCLNGVYFTARLIAGLRAAARGRGEVGRFPGPGGKLRVAATILKADLKAACLIPRMLRKRRQFQPPNRLTPRQVKQMLRRFRIPLRELMEEAI